MFDIYTIIFLALAVFIFLRLRSVLGQRTGRERPPYDPYSAREVRGATNDNVVTLPGRGGEAAQKPVDTSEPGERWKGIAETGSAAAVGLDSIAREDKSFDAKHFIAGARAIRRFTKGMRPFLHRRWTRQPCWRHGRDRLWSPRRD